MLRSLLVLFSCLWFLQSANALPSERLPIPPASANRLFYIQRSSNANTVIYDANFLPNKSLNPSQPVHTYWIRYADNGQKEELNLIQRTLAYGLYTNKIKNELNSFEGYFLAYRKRKFVVQLNAKNQAIALFPINGKLQILERVFVSVDDSGFTPAVNYIELFGKDEMTNKDVYERFKP